jgi:asparagine synthetase B (glutamine-hydrolysing)
MNNRINSASLQTKSSFKEELFMQDNALVTKEEWVKRINDLRENVNQDPNKKLTIVELERLKTKWKETFENAILERARSVQGKVGVLFSGGVDSTIIAYVLHKNNIPFTCFTIGYKDEMTKDPEDVIEALKIAEEYGWKTVTHVVTKDQAEVIFKKTITILKEYSMPVTVGVGAVVYAGCEIAKEHGVSTLFAGLGSEEIFAGYRRHERSIVKDNDAAVHDECWRGLICMYNRDLIRDTRICAATGVCAFTPFMDPQVIACAMQMPSSEKIKDGLKKYVLRAMAEEYGLRHEYAFRPKRAAQYGSRFDYALDKLSFDRKCDYIEGILGYKPIM